MELRHNLYRNIIILFLHTIHLVFSASFPSADIYNISIFGFDENTKDKHSGARALRGNVVPTLWNSWLIDIYVHSIHTADF